MVTTVDDIPKIIEELCAVYDESVANLRDALARYLTSAEIPDARARADGLFAYPELIIDHVQMLPKEFPSRAFGRLNYPGRYATSIARPRLFRKYLREQLGYLVRDYQVEVSVGRSRSEIPYPYVLDGSEDLQLEEGRAAELARTFPTPELVQIGDEIADGAWIYGSQPERPLSLFDAPRVDFSLARLRHYTGTPAHHTQRYVLFTN